MGKGSGLEGKVSASGYRTNFFFLLKQSDLATLKLGPNANALPLLLPSRHVCNIIYTALGLWGAFPSCPVGSNRVARTGFTQIGAKDFRK